MKIPTFLKLFLHSATGSLVCLKMTSTMAYLQIRISRSQTDFELFIWKYIHNDDYVASLADALESNILFEHRNRSTTTWLILFSSLVSSNYFNGFFLSHGCLQKSRPTTPNLTKLEDSKRRWHWTFSLQKFPCHWRFEVEMRIS